MELTEATLAQMTKTFGTAREGGDAAFHRSMRAATLVELIHARAAHDDDKRHLAEMTRQRDLLAQRCAAQAQEIGRLQQVAAARIDVEAVLTAVRAEADEAGAFHFDMLRRALAR